MDHSGSTCNVGEIGKHFGKELHCVGIYAVNFQRAGEPYPLVVLMGGRTYMNFTSVPATLDNLIAEKRIPPVVAVAVNGSNDNPCSPEFANFLATELVPWMRSTYHATDNPAQTVIGGSGLGGSHQRAPASIIRMCSEKCFRNPDHIDGSARSVRVRCRTTSQRPNV